MLHLDQARDAHLYETLRRILPPGIPVPELVKVVRLFDRWKANEIMSEEINEALRELQEADESGDRFRQAAEEGYQRGFEAGQGLKG